MSEIQVFEGDGVSEQQRVKDAFRATINRYHEAARKEFMENLKKRGAQFTLSEQVELDLLLKRVTEELIKNLTIPKHMLVDK